MTAVIGIPHIATDAAIRGGQPHIQGTRIAVSDIVIMHLRLGQSLEEIAGKYDLSLAAAHAAMSYFYDHRAEIEERIDGDAAYVAAFRRDNPGPLREKLQALSG